MRRTLLSAVAFVVLVLALWGAFHFMIPWIHPDQEPPEDHATSVCWSCHIVSGSTEIVELEDVER